MNKSQPLLKNDGERMIPEYHKGSLIYAEHYIRYLSAEMFTKDKVVLDIACGSGYGSQLLARNAKKVIGVDVDAGAVAYAKRNFSSSNLEYKVGDGEKIPLEDNSIDTVITFETIEHIPNYKKFMKEVKRVLRPDGIAIVSTPNDLEFAEGNHFHLHEFKYKELHDMLKKDFEYIDSYYQATAKYVALGSDEIFNKEGSIDIDLLNLAPQLPKQYLYFYLVCSNQQITSKIRAIAAIGSHYSDRQNDQAYRDGQALEANHKSLQETHQKIAQQLTEAINQRRNLELEIKTIKSSKSYKASLRLSKIKNKLSNH